MGSTVSSPSGKVVRWFLLRFKSLRHSSWPSSAGKHCSSLQLTSWERRTQKEYSEALRPLKRFTTSEKDLDTLLPSSQTLKLTLWTLNYNPQGHKHICAERMTLVEIGWLVFELCAVAEKVTAQEDTVVCVSVYIIPAVGGVWGSIWRQAGSTACCCWRWALAGGEAETPTAVNWTEDYDCGDKHMHRHAHTQTYSFSDVFQEA